MILFDWLLQSEKQIINKISSTGNITSYSNINNDSSNLTDIIINFILKFLCSNKDIKVLDKFLFIIIGQKGFDFIDNKKKIKNNFFINDNYIKILNSFSSSKTKFLQFLEELMINSFLCLHINEAKKNFIIIEENSNTQQGNTKDNNENFKTIYLNTKELINDIYFNEINLNKNDIIYEIINIILSSCNGLKDKKDLDEMDIKKREILFLLLKEFLNDIIEIYNAKLDYYKKKMFKKKNSKELLKQKINDFSENEIEEKIHSIYQITRKSYAVFVTFIFEYIILLVNSNNYISNMK